MRRLCAVIFFSDSGREYEAEFYVNCYHESKYNADADGNRGTPMDFREYDGLEDLWVWTNRARFRQMNIEKIPKRLEAEMNRAIDKYIDDDIDDDLATDEEDAKLAAAEAREDARLYREEADG
jgi:hypothetical protein